MTNRNLTSNFFQFRSRAVRDRIFHANDKSNDDCTVLLETEDEEVVHYEKTVSPLWIELRQRIQVQFDEVQGRIKKLQQLQCKRLKRPDFDENSSEEKEIESMTKDIISMLRACQTSVQRFSLQAGKSRPNSYDQHLISNAIQATLTTLQDLTTQFRQCQSTYHHKLESRKDNFTSLMPNFEINMHSNPFGGQDDPNKDFDQISLTSEGQQQMSSQDNEFLEKRNAEIREVFQSMNDVNNIFHDVATLVSNQRVHLDQIECHIEDTVVKLEQGNEQLVQAVKHQQRSLKCKLIVIGIGLLVLLFIILMSVVSR